MIRIIFLVLGLIAGISGIAFYWPSREGSFIDIVAAAFFLLFGPGIGFLLSLPVNKIVSLFGGKNSDYPALMEGHWGLTLEGVTIEAGEKGVGPIEYYLQLCFLNPDSARRVKEAYPFSRVIKGDI